MRRKGSGKIRDAEETLERLKEKLVADDLQKIKEEGRL